jgi:ABC-type Zn2+ transport system substrate-binding protein/surface adhesin
MIKTQELKSQIDELTKQNDMVLNELEQVKKLLTQSENQQDGSGSSSTSQEEGNSEDAQNTQDGKQSSKEKDQSQKQKDSPKDVSQLATDLLVIKDLVEKLEKKTSQYISDQSSGQLTEKDVVNLILTMMNGMVDWTSEYVSRKNPESKQLQ